MTTEGGTLAAGLRQPGRLPVVGLLALATLAASVAGLAAGVLNAPPQSAAAAGGLLLIAIVAVRPATGVWLWLLAAPLIVGFARGGGLGVLRPNEVLLLAVAAGVGLNALLRLGRSERVFPAINAIDVTVAALVVTGSAMPLLMRYGRDLPLTQDDLLYALVFVKYLVLYGVVRMAVRTERELAIGLWLALAAGAVVAMVALLQVGDLLGVPRLLAAYYDTPFEGSSGPSIGRATSTIASAFGLADMMAMCLAIAVAWLVAGCPRRFRLAIGCALFLAGSVASGSFSGFIGVAVAAVATGYVVNRLGHLVTVALPAGAVAAVALWPVIAGRLEGFETRLALPRSWLGRLENLERFFWPEVFSGLNWLVGVGPAARVPAPETWRDWVYIESGYTWLLWSGGLPLLVAFAAFVVVVGRSTLATARTASGSTGIAAAAAFAATVMIGVLMLLDPHLTVRGSADLYFPLIALSLVTPVTTAATYRATA